MSASITQLDNFRDTDFSGGYGRVNIPSMRIIEGTRSFDIDTVLSKPLFAHLATSSQLGARDSPVWFLWEDATLWIIGHKETDTFPKRILADSRVAVGIVDFNAATGLVRHVGIRGTAQVAPFNRERVKRLFTKYLGANEEDWDQRLTGDVIRGDGYLLVKVTPDTAVVRDQSYRVRR